jgi:transmembrane sensor
VLSILEFDVPQKGALSEDDFLEAASWWRRAQTGTSEDLARVEDWLNADAKHVEAFAYMRSVMDGLDEGQASPDLLRFRAQALARAEKSWRRTVNSGTTTRRVLMGSVAAGLAAAVAVPAYLVMHTRKPQVFTTGIGEQHTVVLADGSKVLLDANSQVAVAYTREKRALSLLKGRAHFDVAKDASRPFAVDARGNTVTAVGTQFYIDLRRQAVAVSLFEGRIRVARKAGSSGDAETIRDIAPSQEVVLYDNEALSAQYKVVNADEELAWQKNQLFFDEAPLSEVVDRLNDYSQTKIHVEGAAANIPVSGMYVAGQTSAFVNAIQKFYPVRVRVTDSDIVIQAKS